MTKKYVFRELVLFTTMCALSGATTFYIMANSSSSQDNGSVEEEQGETMIPQTPAEKLFSSLTSIQKADFDVNLSFTDSNTMVGSELKAVGSLDLSDSANVLAYASINANIDGVLLDSDIHYITDTVYMDYNNSKLSLKTSDVESFVDIFMGMGINIDLPAELTNIDLNDILARLNTMEPKAANDGGYVFALDIVKPGTTVVGNNGEERPATPLTVYFKSDAEYNFTGASTNNIAYEGLYLMLDAKVESKNPKCEGLINQPVGVYQNFKPALNVIETLFNVFGKEQQTLDFNVKLKKLAQTQAVEGEASSKVPTEIKDYLNIGGQLSIDNMKDVSVDLNLHEYDFKRDHNVKIMLNDNTLYLNYADFNKISLRNSTVMNVVDYLLNSIDQAAFEELLNKLMDQATGIDMDFVLSKINSINALLDKVEVLNENGVDIFRVTVSPSNILPPDAGIEISDIVFDLSSNPKTNEGENSILGIHLNEIRLGNVAFDLDIKSNNKFNLLVPDVKDEYVEIDGATNVLPGVLDLIKQDRFHVLLDMDLTSDQPNVKPVTLDGELQVELNNPGYQATKVNNKPLELRGVPVTTDTTNPVPLIDVFGNMTIKDRDEFGHNIVLDLDDSDTMRFVYNDATKGFVGMDALNQTISVVTDFINTNDAHINELFGDLIKALGETPLGNAIATGDIGAIIASKAFKINHASENELSLSVNLALMGMEGWFDLKIGYDFTLGLQNVTIENLTFTESNGAKNTIKFVLSLSDPIVDSENALVKGRLDETTGGFDLNFLPITLETILNTTTYDGFVMSGNVNLDVIKLIKANIPLSARVQNNAGKVDAKIKLDNMDLVSQFMKDPTLDAFGCWGGYKRNSTVYLKDSKDLYADRYDQANKIEGFHIVNPNKYAVNTRKHILANTFFDNALEFICKDTLGFDDNTMKKIVGDPAQTPTEPAAPKRQIQYQLLVNKLLYDDANRCTVIELNMNELTGMTIFGNLTLRLFEDSARPTNQPRILKNIEATLSIVKVVKAKVTVSLDEYATNIDVNEIAQYDLAHNSDPLNVSVATKPRLV